MRGEKATKIGTRIINKIALVIIAIVFMYIQGNTFLIFVIIPVVLVSMISAFSV